MIKDSLGIVSLNGDKSSAQTISLKIKSGSLGFSTPSAGSQVLSIPLASKTDTGLISPNDQIINGTKTLLRSPIINTLSPGSVVFIGNNDSLAENNNTFFWDKNYNRLGIGMHPDTTLEINSGTIDKSGLRFKNLTNESKVNDPSALAIGVNKTGDVVRTNGAPVYYNSSGNILNPQVQKIIVDSILGSSVSDTMTIYLPSIGLTKIIDVQLNVKIQVADGPYGAVANIVDWSPYNTSYIKVRINEFFYTTSGGLLNLGSLTKGGTITLPQTYTILGSNGFDPKPYTIYYRVEGY